MPLKMADLAGKSTNQILEELLVPVLYPTLTSPTNSFTSDASPFYEVGEIVTINFTSNFNRGTINPAYSTSGFRSGLPTAYNYSGDALPTNVPSTSLSDSQSLVNYTIVQGYQTFTSNVDFSAGEQPLNSKGGNFSSALSSGNSGDKYITIEGVYPVFANTDVINSMEKQSLVSMYSTELVLILAAESGGDKQSFELSNYFAALSGVQTFNTVSNSYEYQGGSELASLANWDVSYVTETVQGVSADYTKYTYSGTDRSNIQIKLIF